MMWGLPSRTNVDRSYRMGVELDGSLQWGSRWAWSANLTISQNKIKRFTEVLYDYGLAFDEFTEIRNNFSNTDISFSPNVIGGSLLSYRFMHGLEIGWLSKYVGRQFLDNTSHTNRQLEAYFVNDLRVSYALRPSWMHEISISLLVNNLFNEAYESNGFTYGYFGGTGNEYRQNFFYPQAGRNFLLMIGLRF
jgi:iron complex outermembrane recepter protein